MANSPDNRAYSYTELTVPSLAVAVAQSKSTKENLLGLLHQILPDFALTFIRSTASKH